MAKHIDKNVGPARAKVGPNIERTYKRLKDVGSK